MQRLMIRGGLMKWEQNEMGSSTIDSDTSEGSRYGERGRPADGVRLGDRKQESASGKERLLQVSQ